MMQTEKLKWSEMKWEMEFPFTGQYYPRKINSFDLDGVLDFGPGFIGLRPDPHDVICTGRSVDEKKETLEYLATRGIFNEVFFNPLPFERKTRETSAQHKVYTLHQLLNEGYEIGIHFEDDPIQAEIIQESVPEIYVVRIDHRGLINYENERRNLH